MDDLDRKLLTVIQKDFPLEPRPFQVLGNELGLSEEEVMNRISALKSAGYIRRLGAVMDSRRLGYYSTLCCMSVPEERLAEVAARVNAIDGVTHNYLRDDHYNLWFTLIAPTEEYARNEIKALEADCDLKVYNLPAERFYKIQVNFPLE